LSSTFGFTPVAYSGPETGVRDRVSYLLEQGTIRYVVTSSLVANSPISEHVRRHGDGVRTIAFSVDDAAAAFETVSARGAATVARPVADEDDFGKLVAASVATYGDTIHTFIERRNYTGLFGPTFQSAEGFVATPGGTTNLTRIDHVVGNVGRGDLDSWCDWYSKVFGFGELAHFDDETIATEFSSLRSTVMWNGGSVVMPINEPADGRRKSQIQEYLDYYESPGVQHVAMHTSDILSSVTALRDRGVRMLRVPAEYYDEAKRRMEGIDLPWNDLAELGILVDRDPEGYLLQIFTETVTDRPCMFFEIIQREGAKGFGAGNFKALFESIEREQAKRGNL
jgi:4-hydroxyphenylpyruvate dioxygenase